MSKEAEARGSKVDVSQLIQSRCWVCCCCFSCFCACCKHSNDESTTVMLLTDAFSAKPRRCYCCIRTWSTQETLWRCTYKGRQRLLQKLKLLFHLKQTNERSPAMWLVTSALAPSTKVEANSRCMSSYLQNRAVQFCVDIEPL
jgi:hypothetical protein